MKRKLGAAVDAAREASRRQRPSSKETTFEADWLEADMHLTNLGSGKASRDAPDRIGVKVRQGAPGAEMDDGSRPKSGTGPAPAASVSVAEMKRLSSRNCGRIGFRAGCCREPVAGRAKGRIADSRIAFHVGSQGLQFAAADRLVYREAGALGACREAERFFCRTSAANGRRAR